MNMATPLLLENSFPQPEEMKRKISIFLSRAIRITLLFIYATWPMWSSWLADRLGYRDVSSFDLLFAMIWLPISGAIIALSFAKFGWKQKIKGLLSFIAYNAVTALGISLLSQHLV